MVGVGSRRDDGPVRVSSSNVFAALDTLRKKKKLNQAKKRSSKAQAEAANSQHFWAPAPLTVKSWADVDDDDDYFANTVPPPPVWGSGQHHQAEEVSASEESESEDILGYGDEDEDEEPEREQESPAPMEPVKKVSLPLIVSKEPERQLSKKELKKKELAELEAVLAEFRAPEKEEEEPQHQQNGILENMETAALSIALESKTSKKKKKKASKEAKDSQDEPNDSISQASVDTIGSELGEGDVTAVGVKERLKKVALTKKKKSSKELDAAAKAAATEAAARNARLAAAKKKEKSHYNQQPVR